MLSLLCPLKSSSEARSEIATDNASLLSFSFNKYLVLFEEELRYISIKTAKLTYKFFAFVGLKTLNEWLSGKDLALLSLRFSSDIFGMF